MDEKKYRLIALCVILGIGASYMLFLVYTYVQSQRLNEYARQRIDEWISRAPKPGTGEPASDES